MNRLEHPDPPPFTEDDLARYMSEPFPDAPPVRYTVADEPAPSDDGLLEGVWFDGDSLPAPVPCIIERILPAEGVTFLGGQSGAAKSFVAIDAGVALTVGQEFFGREIKEPVGVIYIAAEGAATISSRLAACKKARGLVAKIPFAVLKNVPLLNDGAERRKFITKLQAIARKISAEFGMRTGLVILDTLAAAFAVKDENSAGEMNGHIRAADELGKSVNAATLIVAHYGKAVETGIRGSSASRAAGESVIAVLADRDETTGTCKNRRLVHAKSRIGEEGPVANFELRGIEIEGADGKPFQSAYVATSGGEVDPKPKRLSSRAAAYKTAFEVKFAEAEQIFPFGAEGCAVNAVRRETVRAEFYASWTADGADERKKADAKRQSFNRGEAELKQRNLINTRLVNGVDYVWRVADP